MDMAKITLRLLKFIRISVYSFKSYQTKNNQMQGKEETKVTFLYYSCLCIN